MSANRHLVSRAGIALVILLAGVVAFDVDVRIRAMVVVAAMFTLPGAAILTRFPVADPLVAVATGIALSLAIDTAFALVMIWTGWWYPAAAGVVLGIATCALFLTDLGLARALLLRTDRKPRL